MYCVPKRKLSLFLHEFNELSKHLALRNSKFSVLLKERERSPTARHHSFRRGCQIARRCSPPPLHHRWARNLRHRRLGKHSSSRGDYSRVGAAISSPSRTFLVSPAANRAANTAASVSILIVVVIEEDGSAAAPPVESLENAGATPPHPSHGRVCLRFVVGFGSASPSISRVS